MPSQNFFIPELPPIDADFSHITGMLKSIGNLPKLTDTLVPRAESLLSEQGQFLLPEISAIRERGAGMEAGAISDMGARGMRGSDIEASAILGARQGALGEESRLRGQFGMGRTNAMLDILTKAMSGDMEAATQLRTLLAQAMGQELGSQRDMQMFIEHLNASKDMAARANKTALWGAGIGAAGSLSAGAMKLLSDRRLKASVKKVGQAAGLSIVSFRWNEKARGMGAPKGMQVGVIAQDVERKYPEAIGNYEGFKTVDYSKLPPAVTAEIKEI